MGGGGGVWWPTYTMPAELQGVVTMTGLAPLETELLIFLGLASHHSESDVGGVGGNGAYSTLAN